MIEDLIKINKIININLMVLKIKETLEKYKK